MSEWFIEKNFDHGWSQTFLGDKIYDQQSPYQNIKVIQTELFGRVLLLDDIIQCTEKDEESYHEMMVHVPLFAHNAAKNVLVIGGGDGGIIKQVLKHQDVEKITLVEIDEQVIKVSKNLLPSISGGAFDNPRVNVVIGDGVDWVKNSQEKYDIIIVDRPESSGPAIALYSPEFYDDCEKRLDERGILVAQTGNWPINKFELISQLTFASFAFNKASCYLATVSSSVTGATCFLWAADWNINIPSNILLDRIINKNIKDLKYYNRETHLAAFALPNCIKDL